MTSRRPPKPKVQSVPNAEIQKSENGAQLKLIKCRPKLDYLLRSRCRLAFVIISILAMLVVVRSGINASRGYALVATQNQTQELEQENERLRIEIAKLKSPLRIKQIAHDELGMDVPKKMYFSHE
ncbi:MAG: cell division protein FtsL [Selenomonadaceae bacterium]|nr:cell division protein FtsL [Selenomonadaceae bacterium]